MQTPRKNIGEEARVLGDFELIEKLGEGAMGEVWKAYQISFDRVVALKILFPHVAKNDKLVRRLRREGLAMNLLEHPNIISAFAVDEAEGAHYVAMEYVDGLTLQKWLDRLGRFDIGDALAIIIACARALEYAHAQGMVHRDIKPENVLIDRRGTVKVGDFGMVKTADEDMDLTQTGHAVGTPWYMPLEQARNAKDAAGPCDIYALGCVLYGLVTGAPPFVGRTIVDVIEAKEIGTFPPARSINPEVPERLDLIIVKMTAKSPKYRYQNCADVIHDLEGLGLAAPRLGFLEGKSKPTTALNLNRTAPTVIDPKTDSWYLRVHVSRNELAVRRLTTTQLKKMLEEGTVDPAAQASRQATDGFRSLATYKEFQGTAFVRQAKKGADTQTARFRSIYKRIEEDDRKRDLEEQKHHREPSYYSQLWAPTTLLAVGIAGVVIFFYIFIKLFS